MLPGARLSLGKLVVCAAAWFDHANSAVGPPEPRVSSHFASPITALIRTTSGLVRVQRATGRLDIGTVDSKAASAAVNRASK